MGLQSRRNKPLSDHDRDIRQIGRRQTGARVQNCGPIMARSAQSRRTGRAEFEEVARWFEARSVSTPFSFEYVCEVLELEPESFRRRLRMVEADALPMKQLRSLGRRQRVQSAHYAKKRSSWEA